MTEAQRLETIGASEVYHLFGLGSFWDLFAAKRPDLLGLHDLDTADKDDADTSDTEELTSEAAMLDRGHRLEAPVAKWAADLMREPSRAFPVRATLRAPGCVVSATPDFVLMPDDLPGVLLEVKTAIVRGEWGEPGTDEVPLRVGLQVNTQLGMARLAAETGGNAIEIADETGLRQALPIDQRVYLDRAYVARLDARLLLTLYEVPYNAPLFAETLDRATKFWRDHVQAGRAPEPGASAKARAWLKAAYPRGSGGPIESVGAETEALVDQWLKLKRAIAPQAAQLKDLEAKLKARIGEREGLLVRGLSGALFWKNEGQGPSWKTAARRIAERLALQVPGGVDVEALLEEESKRATPADGKRVLRWSSKLNPLK